MRKSSPSVSRIGGAPERLRKSGASASVTSASARQAAIMRRVRKLMVRSPACRRAEWLAQISDLQAALMHDRPILEKGMSDALEALEGRPAP